MCKNADKASVLAKKKAEVQKAAEKESSAQNEWKKSLTGVWLIAMLQTTFHA